MNSLANVARKSKKNDLKTAGELILVKNTFKFSKGRPDLAILEEHNIFQWSTLRQTEMSVEVAEPEVEEVPLGEKDSWVFWGPSAVLQFFMFIKNLSMQSQ